MAWLRNWPLRQWFHYRWENGSTLNVSLFGEIPTEKALGMLEEFIAMKREEINANNPPREGRNQ